MSHMPTSAQPLLSPATASLTNASGATAVAGTPVYSSAAGSYSKAIATSAAAALCIGLATADTTNGSSGVVQSAGIVTLTTAQWDAVCGTTGGLTYGVSYYVSAATAGALTSTAPSTAGQFVAFVGSALSATQLDLNRQPPIGL